MLAFTSIFLTAVAAFAGAPIWTAIIGSSVLLSISLREQRKLATRFSSVNASHVLTVAGWRSAGHALIACCAAWALGAAMHLLAY